MSRTAATAPRYGSPDAAAAAFDANPEHFVATLTVARAATTPTAALRALSSVAQQCPSRANLARLDRALPLLIQETGLSAAELIAPDKDHWNDTFMVRYTLIPWLTQDTALLDIAPDTLASIWIHVGAGDKAVMPSNGAGDATAATDTTPVVGTRAMAALEALLPTLMADPLAVGAATAVARYVPLSLLQGWVRSGAIAADAAHPSSVDWAAGVLPFLSFKDRLTLAQSFSTAQGEHRPGTERRVINGLLALEKNASPERSAAWVQFVGEAMKLNLPFPLERSAMAQVIQWRTAAPDGNRIDTAIATHWASSGNRAAEKKFVQALTHEARRTYYGAGSTTAASAMGALASVFTANADSWPIWVSLVEMDWFPVDLLTDRFAAHPRSAVRAAAAANQNAPKELLDALLNDPSDEVQRAARAALLRRLT